ncbi:MAG: CRTAC1 family protein, partial [Verrucomicrobiota bacterium]
MKTNYLSKVITALILSLASLTLPPVGDLHAAEIFTKVTTGPGSDVGNNRGAAWGDYDGDGFIDLFAVNIGAGGSGPARHFLYHNNGNGTFSRVTNGPLAVVESAGRGAVWGDYDNDGQLDLALMSVDQPNYLFHNNGGGSFAAVPGAVFVSDLATSRGVNWVDYDSDGYLDLFRVALDQPRRLYRNNHDGTFTRITQGAFLTAAGTFLSAAWGDYNNDGRPDLFLPNADQSNYLYRNDGGGTFTRVGAGMLDGSFHGESAAWGDYDNDGDLDLFVACALAPGTGSSPNFLYRNDGNGVFTSLTTLPANDPDDQGGASRGCTWGDYDNDGWLDLFVGNRAGQNDYLYHNNGDGTFTKVTNSIAANDGADSQACAWGDYDNDGFLDLFVGNFSGTNFLYRNNGNDNHWLKLRLINTLSNRAALGAKVRVRATINGQTFWQMREVLGGDGSPGQNSLHVHVGLGNATNADLVRIEWPSGTVQELSNVA